MLLNKVPSKAYRELTDFPRYVLLSVPELTLKQALLTWM